MREHQFGLRVLIPEDVDFVMTVKNYCECCDGDVAVIDEGLSNVNHSSTHC